MQAALAAAPAVINAAAKYGPSILQRIRARRAARLGKRAGRARRNAKSPFKPLHVQTKRPRRKRTGFKIPRRADIGITQRYPETQRTIEVAATTSEPYFAIEGHSRDGQSMTISGHEALGVVSTTGATPTGAELTRLSLSPTNFARLQSYANLFSTYKFIQAHFSYVPAISLASANANGMLQLAYQSDPGEELPPITAESVKETFSWMATRESAVFSANSIQMPAAMALKEYFTDPSSSDVRLVTQGIFLVRAATDLAGPVNFGKIYLTYKIILSTPHTNPRLITSGGKVAGGGTLSLSNMLGTAPATDPQAVGITALTNNTVKITQPGQYMVHSVVNGSGLATPVLPSVSGTGASNFVLLTSAVGTASQWFCTHRLLITSDDNVLTFFTGGAGTVSSSNLYLSICPLNSLLASVSKRNPVSSQTLTSLLEGASTQDLILLSQKLSELSVDDYEDNARKSHPKLRQHVPKYVLD